MPRFNEEDEELVSLIKEYEKYVRSTPGNVEDFDEWLELQYGKSKSKVMKPSNVKINRHTDIIKPPPLRLRFKTGEFVSDVESDETPQPSEDQLDQGFRQQFCVYT